MDKQDGQDERTLAAGSILPQDHPCQKVKASASLRRSYFPMASRITRRKFPPMILRMSVSL
jgi:hypothetical protein